MHRRLFFLVGGHIALDVLFLALTFLTAWPVYLPAMCLAPAQLSLAAIWFGLARSGWRRRVTAAVAAVCCSTLLMTLAFAAFFQAHHPSYRLGLMDAFPLWPHFAISNTTKFVGVAATVLGLRWWRVQLHQASDLGPSSTASGFRFSILHLMLLTLLVAISLAVGQHVRAVVQTAALALLALWASLAVGRPHWRIIAALVLSNVVGLAAPFFLAGSRGQFIFGTFYAAMHTAIVVASLLVVRSCGYRLVVSRVAQPVHAADSGQPAAG